MSTKSISIVICTFNRCDLLLKTLNSFKHVLIHNIEYELIVIDNNSNDNTKVITSEFISSNPNLNIKYILEAQQGLSYARNRGITEAEGNILTFIDDDVILTETFIQEIINAFERNPEVSIIGGKVDLYYINPKPNWISSNLESYLSKQDLGQKDIFINFNENWLVGANISFRASLLDLHNFNTDLGRKGSSLISGEETELCKRIIKNDSSVRAKYIPSILLYHIITEERIKRSFFIKRIYAGGISKSIERNNNDKKIKFSIYISLVINIVKLILSIFHKRFFTIFLVIVDKIGELNGFKKIPRKC